MVCVLWGDNYYETHVAQLFFVTKLSSKNHNLMICHFMITLRKAWSYQTDHSFCSCKQIMWEHFPFTIYFPHYCFLGHKNFFNSCHNQPPTNDKAIYKLNCKYGKFRVHLNLPKKPGNNG